MQAKGISLLGVLTSLKALHGDAMHDAAVALLPGELGDHVRYRTLLTGAWYPLDWYRQVHLAAQRATGRDADLARDLSREATLRDFRGIYRILTFVLSPQAIIRKAPSVWSRYYDAGEVTIPEARDGIARARFAGCSGFDRSLWEDAIGGSTAVLEACGAKDLEVKIISGGADGDDQMEIEAHWVT